MYDLRNLYQVNVEEGRHLWAMVYLLHAYFGRDGREEAAELLLRHSGDPDRPRILGAFNETTPNWLSYYMFTFFTDRDGKYQLASLAESGFDPLARTCQFMLTEEAHHMFVGETGVLRTVQRTAEVMRELRSDNVERIRAAGAIDLATIQRYINLHFAVSLDLFGSELSTNAATYFATGLKGRFQESRLGDDHDLSSATWPVEVVRDGRIVKEQQAARNALNERLRDDYIVDCQRGMDRWNAAVREAGIDVELRLPHRGFNRRVGLFREESVTPDGRLIDGGDWAAQRDRWLPSEADDAFVASLMGRVVEPGAMASWIAPPARGINGKPVDFEYVRFG
jgi:benzoyl-CoA 2,3-dioxygenase component B